MFVKAYVGTASVFTAPDLKKKSGLKSHRATVPYIKKVAIWGKQKLW